MNSSNVEIKFYTVVWGLKTSFEPTGTETLSEP